MNRTLLTLVTSIYFITVPSLWASEVQPKLTDQQIFPQFDQMKFKTLRDHSLVNKAHYQQVLRYFQARLARVKATPCPVLDQQWINENSGREFAKGHSSFYSESRLPPVQELWPVTTIGEMIWNISIREPNKEPMGLPDTLSKEMLGNVQELRAQEEGTTDHLGAYGVFKKLTEEFPDDPPAGLMEGPKTGPMVTKYCRYFTDNQKTNNPEMLEIELWAGDEFLEMPELGIEGELIG